MGNFEKWNLNSTSEDKFIAELVASVRSSGVSDNEIQTEVVRLILAAQSDLMLGGIKKSRVENFNDPLIHRAITLYFKSEFGLDNPDSEKYYSRYKTLKDHMMMSNDYIGPEEV